MSQSPTPNIANVLRNARLMKPGRRVMLDDQMAQLVDELFALLDARGVDYLLVGGLAFLSYVPGRNTEDIDLILTVADLNKLTELRVETRDANHVRADFHGLQLVVLLATDPFFERIQRDFATRRDFSGHSIPAVTPDGLVLLKLYALPSLHLQGDFDRVALYETDLTMLLHRYPQDAARLWDALSGYLTETDLKLLRDVYGDIQARIQRYPKRS